MKNVGQVCIIIQKVNQIGCRVCKNEVLKTLTQNLNIVDAKANDNANATGSEI